MARRPDYVTRVETGAGVRYEVRINTLRANGRRSQQKRRFATVEAAVAWHSKITAEVSAGTHIAPSELTVRAACEAWLAGKRIKPTTHDAYSAALAPVIEKYGDKLVQKITKSDVENLVIELSTGTGPRGAWKRTSINPMLARWRSVWKDLHAQGVLPRNVVQAPHLHRRAAQGPPAVGLRERRTGVQRPAGTRRPRLLLGRRVRRRAQPRTLTVRPA